MSDTFVSGDELGPFKIIHVREPSVGLQATLVIDNVAMGPAIGGVRMAPDVSTTECARLARTMTLKNAAAGLVYGGGKAVLYGDPKMDVRKKELLIRALACSLKEIEQYIFAPDMGTDENCMAWIKDEINRVVGLPLEIGGIPLDQIGATGLGLRHVTEIAAQQCNIPLKGARVVIQGFGAVGKHTARFLSKQGCVLVGAADSKSVIYNSQGLDVNKLIALKEEGKSFSDCTEGQQLEGEEIVDIACDIWIPAARPDVIHEENMHRLNAKLVVEGANIPITSGAEKYLHEKGILCIPDFIANAGGVICAAMEFEGACQKEVFDRIEEKIRSNTRQMLKLAREKNILPRDAAIDMAMQRVNTAMGYKRWKIF